MMKSPIFGLFILFSACSVTSKSDHKSTIEQKEKLYPYFNIGLDALTVSDSSVHFSKAEKLVMLDALDKMKFIVNSIEFQNQVELLTMRGDYDINGCTGISMEYDKPVDSKRVLEAVRRFSYDVTIIKSSTISSLGAAASVEFYPFHPFPDPLYRQVPHFYVIDLNNLQSMKGRVHMNDDYDYAVDHPYYSTAAAVFHEMLHNMGGMHNIHSDYDMVHNVEKAFRKASQDPFFEKYKNEWEAFKGYYQEKFGHLL